MAKVQIYTTGACPYCVSAKQLLASKGVQYEEVRVDLNSEKRDEMLSRANGRRTVPQIFIGDVHVGGFDDLSACNKAGQLDELLSK